MEVGIASNISDFKCVIHTTYLDRLFLLTKITYSVNGFPHGQDIFILTLYDFEVHRSIYADGYENRPAVGWYTPCWLNLATDEREYTSKHDTKSAYEECMDTLKRNGFFEAYKDNERFERLLATLKEKISK